MSRKVVSREPGAVQELGLEINTVGLNLKNPTQPNSSAPKSSTPAKKK